MQNCEYCSMPNVMVTSQCMCDMTEQEAIGVTRSFNTLEAEACTVGISQHVLQTFLNCLSTPVPVSGKRLHDVIWIHTHAYSIVAKSSVDIDCELEILYSKYCSCLCIIP